MLQQHPYPGSVASKKMSNGFQGSLVYVKMVVRFAQREALNRRVSQLDPLFKATECSCR
jgi:hypothetical protein